MALSLATAFLFGLIPAIRASRTDLQASLHGEGRKTAHAPTSAARQLLVAADIAMAVVLLIGAGLMIKSVGRLLGVNPGFDPDHVLTLQVSMVGTGVREGRDRRSRRPRRSSRGFARCRASKRRPPPARFRSAATATRGAFTSRAGPTGPEDPSVERYAVTPDYFSVMRIPLRRGRLLNDGDRTDTENVMLIGEQTARTVWPGEDPIGRHVKIGGDRGPWRTIVGIVGDVRHHDLAARADHADVPAADAEHRSVPDAGDPDIGRAVTALAPDATAGDRGGGARRAGVRGRAAGGARGRDRSGRGGS